MEHEMTEEVIQAARAHPGGFIYKIVGSFGPDTSSEYSQPILEF